MDQINLVIAVFLFQRDLFHDLHFVLDISASCQIHFGQIKNERRADQYFKY